jgi:hypothetical protein
VKTVQPDAFVNSVNSIANKRISIHNLGKNRSETARKEIEDKYGLVKAGSTHKQTLHTNLNKALYGKSEAKRTIDNIVGEVMKRYKFSSLTEFNVMFREGKD